jgi:hypothetical protein
MDDLDKTFRALKRKCSFELLRNKIEIIDNGSYTFSRMNAENRWKVTSGYENLIEEHGWTVDDFNYQLHKKYDG